MASKLVNIVAVATLALLTSSFGPTPVNALSVDYGHNHLARHASHHVIAKRQQTSSASRKRCRARTTGLAAPASTSAASEAPTSQPAEQPAPSQPADNPPAPPADTPAPAPPPPNNPPPAPPSPGRGVKGGIAWANQNDDRIANFVSWKTDVVYTWFPYKPPVIDRLGIDFAAMFWGEKQTQDFINNVKPGYCRYVMGFNEPNQEGQAWMAPERGADLWAQYIEPLKWQGFQTVSPAPTNAPSGKLWLQNWLNACGGRCTPDFIGTHFYGTRAGDLIAHLQDYYNTFQKPLWLTEFACQNFGGGAQCSYQEVVNFMNEATGFMDSSPIVDHYFWFGFLDDMNNVNYDNKLIGGDDRPNELGRNYLDL